jgi:hypothetical protein
MNVLYSVFTTDGIGDVRQFDFLNFTHFIHGVQLGQ